MARTAVQLRQALHERFGEDINIPAGMGGLDELLRIATYSSHRSWTETPVDPGILKVLVACALSAPSKSYLQQADIVQVQDPEKRASVERLVPAMPWLRNAPVLLVFCGNGRRFRHLFSRKGLPFANEHLDGFFNPVVDSSLVMMNFIRAAAAVGLVSCPISVLRDQALVLAQILELADHVFPVAGLCLGYPSQQRSINPRLSLSASFHIDRFDDGTSDEQLADFDVRYVAARRSITKDAGRQDPTTWSDEKTKQYASAQRADWGAFVRSKKFDLR